MKWPQRSLDRNPFGFFSLRLCKDTVSALPLPQTVGDLKRRVVEAIQQMSKDLLQLVNRSFPRRPNLVEEKGLTQREMAMSFSVNEINWNHEWLCWLLSLLSSSFSLNTLFKWDVWLRSVLNVFLIFLKMICFSQGSIIILLSYLHYSFYIIKIAIF